MPETRVLDPWRELRLVESQGDDPRADVMGLAARKAGMSDPPSTRSFAMPLSGNSIW
jgi:hypothetical protein